jgi:caa(3)-type oxidase subunit IV
MAGESHTTKHSSGITAYLVIFVALCIFTAVSFLVNSAVRGGSISTEGGFLLIMGVAICKAVLVAMFFMHLKIDWPRLYFVIIPVIILGVMMIIVLLPDIVLAWHR